MRWPLICGAELPAQNSPFFLSRGIASRHVGTDKPDFRDSLLITPVVHTTGFLLPAKNGKIRVLAVLLGQLVALFCRKRSKVGFPAWAPPDMPLPQAAQNGFGVLVVPCPQTAFFTVIHLSSRLGKPCVALRKDLYSTSSYFASTPFNTRHYNVSCRKSCPRQTEASSPACLIKRSPDTPLFMNLRVKTPQAESISTLHQNRASCFRCPVFQ
jgi:hypothetical protein